MKQKFFALLILACFFVFLTFPKQTLNGASQGLLLWFQIVIPTLLPFFVLTSLMIYSHAISLFNKLLGTWIGYIFRVSSHGSFAVICGFLCGYPVGAKVTVDLLNTKKITLSEAKYLLSFCNNTSPVFITSYIVLQCFQEEALLLPTILLTYLSPIICSFIFRKFYPKPNPTVQLIGSTSFQFDFVMLDDCIMSAFESITKIGGYIILFSIFFELGKLLPIPWLLPILEITNGIPYILKRHYLFAEYYPLTLALTSFGGLCSIAQTNSIIKDSPLSIWTYTIQKLITTMVTSLLALLYVIILHHQ